jgi:hypothetical protein
MLFRRHDERGPDYNQKKGKELAARKRPNQCGVGLPEIFDNDSKDRVTNEEQSGENAVGLSHSRPHNPQNREQRDTLEESFIELRWMSRRQD